MTYSFIVSYEKRITFGYQGPARPFTVAFRYKVIPCGWQAVRLRYRGSGRRGVSYNGFLGFVVRVR
jgi:hypothetical protein